MTPEQEFANMILAMTPKEFDIWAEKMSIEEIARVTYTIQLANQQLREQMECLIEEDEVYIEEELECEYFPEALDVLSKFTLRGLK
jgi:hypothetical protein